MTPEPITLTRACSGNRGQQYEFSPDGRSVLFASAERRLPDISIAQSDGSGVRQLDVGMAAYEPSFRPPDGAEILFVGPDRRVIGSGIFAVDVASGDVRTIVAAAAHFDLAGAVVVAGWVAGRLPRVGRPSRRHHGRTRVVAADGTGDRGLPEPPDAVWDASRGVVQRR